MTRYLTSVLGCLDRYELIVTEDKSMHLAALAGSNVVNCFDNHSTLHLWRQQVLVEVQIHAKSEFTRFLRILRACTSLSLLHICQHYLCIHLQSFNYPFVS